jgi:hypothetical protein
MSWHAVSLRLLCKQRGFWEQVEACFPRRRGCHHWLKLERFMIRHQEELDGLYQETLERFHELERAAKP